MFEYNNIKPQWVRFVIIIFLLLVFGSICISSIRFYFVEYAGILTQKAFDNKGEALPFINTNCEYTDMVSTNYYKNYIFENDSLVKKKFELEIKVFKKDSITGKYYFFGVWK